jgi:hypothetical protein
MRFDSNFRPKISTTASTRNHNGVNERHQKVSSGSTRNLPNSQSRREAPYMLRTQYACNIKTLLSAKNTNLEGQTGESDAQAKSCDRSAHHRKTNITTIF